MTHSSDLNDYIDSSIKVLHQPNRHSAFDAEHIGLTILNAVSSTAEGECRLRQRGYLGVGHGNYIINSLYDAFNSTTLHGVAEICSE